jgi:hypothetical protein
VLHPGKCFNRFSGFLLGYAQLVKALQVKPECRTRAEEMGQTQCRVSGDGALRI